jgi:hypothetical protein
VAYGSSRVVAYGSSRVVAYGSSSVEAYDSSSVEAYDSSRVEANGTSQVHAKRNSTVKATTNVAVHLHSATATVEGGVLIDVRNLDLEDAATWCAHHGVKIRDGRAVLYKALEDDLTTGRQFGHPTVYTAGSDLVCPDWRDDNDCGGGLHLSPAPSHARQYNLDATRYMRCTAALDDLRPILDSASAPKCKVRALRVEAEVDLWRDEVTPAEPEPEAVPA